MTAALNKKSTESKYVSCFADSRPDVDITFRDVLLSRPTDHYLVGVDNFSMTNSSLSMIEPLGGQFEPLIRIVRNRTPDDFSSGDIDTLEKLDAELAGGEDMDGTYLRVVVPHYGELTIKSTEVIMSPQHLMHRLEELAALLNDYMNTGKADASGYEFGGYEPDSNEDTRHLQFDLRADGRLEITGTRAFWSCFSIEVPATQFQFGFYGDRTDAQNAKAAVFRQRRFLSMNPETATPTFEKIIVNNQYDVNQPAGSDYNQRTVQGSATKVLVAESELVSDEQADFNQYTARAVQEISFTTDASIYSTLERRVALEVSCSLPIKNSPMIDHNKESPDFVLGRWIWRNAPRIESNAQGGSRRYSSIAPACTEYQGTQDRITYHELQAQSKIQTLRIKLFARIRKFSDSDETWGMRVIDLPTSGTDWWHTRLHFISKD